MFIGESGFISVSSIVLYLIGYSQKLLYDGHVGGHDELPPVDG